MLSFTTYFDPDVAVGPSNLTVVHAFRTVGVRVHLVHEERIGAQANQLFVFHRRAGATRTVGAYIPDLSRNL